MAVIKVSTGTVVPNKYPNSLANSVHLRLITSRGETILNQGYGMLFAKATIRENNTIEERGCTEPVICRKEDGFYISAAVVDAQGQKYAKVTYVNFKTEDFLAFTELEESEQPTADSLMDSAEIPDTLIDDIIAKWTPVQAVSVEIPENYQIRELRDLDDVRIPVRYSDGSVHKKKAEWRRLSLKNIGNGKYRVEGRLSSVDTGFPLAVGYADPVVFRWNGSWYFLATNDNVNDIGLFCRRADTVEGLFAEDVQEKILLDYNAEKGFCQTFWAPEFHVIGGRLYILFAVSNENWGPQCTMMRLKRGGDIMNPEDWEEPVKVVRKDGSALAPDGISLDMTYIQGEEESYVCWSYRYGIGTSADTGSMLYIATVDVLKPWQLTSEPVLLSRPLYGWENNSGTINNEGPYALYLDDKIYLAFSGGDACGYYYAVGFLTAEKKADLLNPENWTKSLTPVFSSATIDGIQGPGHNSFFKAAGGDIFVAYHAQERDKYFKRCSAMHRLHINKFGEPVFGVAGERDLPEALKQVALEFSFANS